MNGQYKEKSRSSHDSELRDFCLLQKYNCHTTGSLRTHYQSLLDICSLGRTADENTEIILRIHLDTGISLVHIVNNLIFLKENHEIFGDEKHRLLLHGLRNPDAAVLGNTHFST